MKSATPHIVSIIGSSPTE